jgi:enoyl-CoA hydratase
LYPSQHEPLPGGDGETVKTPPVNGEAATITYETVLYQRRGPVAEIMLNRPHVLNELNRQMDLDLMDAFAVAGADEEVRVVLLAGEGRAFCAGADLKERANSAPLRAEDIVEEIRQGLVFSRLWQIDKPTIVAVQGYCLAGGYHLAAMCDVIVAADSARFGEPEVRFANPLLVPVAPFQLGHKLAREVLYSGDSITAERARKLGLVSQVVPEGNLMAAARRLALALAHLSPGAVQAQKRALRFSDERRGFSKALRANAEILALTLSLQPHLQGEEAETFLRTAREQGLKTAVQRRDAPLQGTIEAGVQWIVQNGAGEETAEVSEMVTPNVIANQAMEAGKEMETYQTLEYQQADDGIVKITLNRPVVLNALNRELCRELDAALARAAAVPNLRSVILAGTGRAFSAGIDLKEPDDEPLSESRERHHLRSLVERCLTIWDFPVPVIAAVQGYALGHACDLVLACDFTIAAEGAKLGVPEIRHGGGVAALFYPYTIGMRAARHLLLTGEMIEASQALEIGMVNQVVPVERLQEEVQRLAHRLALIPPNAIRQMKRAINRAYEMMGLRDSLEYNLEALILSEVAQPAAFWEEQQERIASHGLAAFLRQRDRSFEDPAEPGIETST